jgi:hypothetical protein
MNAHPPATRRVLKVMEKTSGRRNIESIRRKTEKIRTRKNLMILSTDLTGEIMIPKAIIRLLGMNYLIDSNTIIARVRFDLAL